jgi:hypothetical protein
MRSFKDALQGKYSQKSNPQHSLPSMSTDKTYRPELLPLSPPKICTNKICPFMSTPSQTVRCNSNCALFRSQKPEGWNCSVQELPDIAFSNSIMRRVALGQDIPLEMIGKSGTVTKRKIDKK